MFEFLRVGVALGARFAQPWAHGELVVVPGTSPVLRMFNPVLNETVVLGLGSSGPQVQSFAVQGSARVPVTVGGVAGSLPVDLIAAAQVAGAGGITGYLTAGTPRQTQAVEMVAVEVGGTDYLIAARPAGSGVEAFRIGTGQALTAVSAMADSGASALAGVSALATATLGGRVFVFAGSASEDGITVLEVGSGGVLTRGATVGQAQAVPMQGLSALETVTAFGATWLVAAAAGSSSLTVFKVGAAGGLTAVDHVVDELATRFQGVTALEVVAHDGWVFVLAAGADEGLTLFAMTSAGQLVHLATVEDQADLGLANISALRAVVVGDALQVVALSGAEAGLTQLSVSLAGLGSVVAAAGGVATGGAERDLILDGAGAEVLTGGAGADLFVMRGDGQRDVIADFDLSADRIDLSGWSFFRNSGQLTVVLTSTGAVLTHGGETLEIRTAEGKALTLAQIAAMDFCTHYRLCFGWTLTGTAGADTVTGTTGNDSLYGLGGTDVLAGGDGRDWIDGGTGDDRLTGGMGTDTVLGMAGNDTLFGSAGEDRLRGGLGTDRLFGGDGLDSLHGEAGHDTLHGEGGADLLEGGDGGDWLYGGEGADLLTGLGGEDHLDGGAGNDRLFGGEGDDSLSGGAGMDSVLGGAGNDRMLGGLGNDGLDGGEGDDLLEGGLGDDRILDGGGADSLWGHAGNDSLLASAGNDTLFGGIGDDSLQGGIGADRLDGGDGHDWLAGGEGVDLLSDGAGNDTVMAGGGDEAFWAGLGDDLIFGDGGNDTLGGGEGRDDLRGGLGTDLLRGQAGDDRLFGGEGADWLLGGVGRDWLEGGAGDDRLEGGVGADSLTGGMGADVFAFAGFRSGEADRITDFLCGTDRLEMRGVAGMEDVVLRDVQVGGEAMAQVMVGGHAILLEGVLVQDLTAGDFVFL